MSSSSEIHVFVVYTEIAFKNLFTLRPFSQTYKNTKDGPFLVIAQLKQTLITIMVTVW